MAKLSRRSIGVTIVAVGIALALIFLAFSMGYRRGSDQAAFIASQNLVNTDNQVPVDFSLFWEAWQRLKDLQVDGASTTPQEFLYGAIGGLASTFHDPYTTYFPPEEARKFAQDISGNFGGIGAEIGLDENDLLVVIAPLKNTPAERAGLKSGDFILKIDDRDTEGLGVDPAVDLIRGEPGTSVTLNIFRKEWGEPKDIVIKREVISVPTLDLSFKDDGKIAVVQLYSFNDNAVPEFEKAAATILTNRSKGVVFDLRNNPGGYLEAAKDLAGWFVDKGSVVVSERFRAGEDQVFRADGNGAFKQLPIVVVINGGSASASEILAGAFRDLRQAKLVGEQSFGKGTVQELNALKDDSVLKITVARWVMPSGIILDHQGLKPDYEVEISDEERAAKKDPQLEKALEVLRGLIK